MNPSQKCCAHCPGNLDSSQNREEHECCVPNYVRGNLKLPSLRKFCPGEKERAIRLKKKPPVERKEAANENEPGMNSIAKKFHAENLQHQPLPDRTEDELFANVLRRNGFRRCACIQTAIERCQQIVPKSPSKILHSPKKQYAPELGCKQPESNMDLAICWEIPTNPVYEPRKPSHVDGSNGGAAPAIFTLIHRNPGMSCGCIDQTNVQPNQAGDQEYCPCCKVEDNEEPGQKTNEEAYTKENERSPSHELCQNLDSITISKHVCGKGTVPISEKNGRRSKYSRQMKHCTACDEEKNREVKFRMQSANCFRSNCKNDKRNGLPPRGMTVPRPRTPFARRSFCIDTLAPPFSVVTGSRDGDYPEHWRLTSIYQQSYRNPKKQRGTILNYR